MVDRFKRWLEPPFFPGDEDKTARAYAAHTMGLYFAGALVVVALVFIPLFVTPKVEAWAVDFTLLFIYGVFWGLLRRGRVGLANGLMLAGIWLVCIWQAVVSGGMGSPILFALMSATMASGLLLSPRSGLAFLAASVAASLVLALLQESGFQLPVVFESSPFRGWVFFSVALILANGLFSLTLRQVGEALTVARVENQARREIEASLRESEERFRGLWENATIGVYRTTPAGQILMANAATVHLLGYDTFEQMASRNLEQDGFEPTYSRSEFRSRLEKDGVIIGLESAWVRKDGATIFVRESAKAIRGESGEILYYDGTFEDITVHKRAALRQQTVHEVLRVVSGQLDADLVARSGVEAIVRLTGYPHVCLAVPEADGQHWVVRGAAGRLAAAQGATYPIHSGVIGRTFATGQMQHVPDILDDPDYVRDVSKPDAPELRSEIVAPMYSAGRLVAALNIESERPHAFDGDDRTMAQSLAEAITLAMENARLFGEARREIAQRKRAEEEARTLLHEKELILKEVHHRVKNNMNAIASLLTMQSCAIASKEAQSELQDASGRVKSLMLLYDKLYRSEYTGAVSIREYLPVLVEEIAAVFPRRTSVTIHTQIDDIFLSPRVLSPLGIIINELITNAMKHAFEGRDSGVISLAAWKKDGRVSIRFEDNGIGMPESVSMERSPGFGTQLIAMLVEQIGGAMTIDRQNGTRYTIEFAA